MDDSRALWLKSTAMLMIPCCTVLQILITLLHRPLISMLKPLTRLTFVMFSILGPVVILNNYDSRFITFGMISVLWISAEIP